jgi:hypothetical protein
VQDPQVWRVLPKGRADILFVVARNLQMRQTKAVAKHGLHKRAGGAASRRILLGCSPLTSSRS